MNRPDNVIPLTGLWVLVKHDRHQGTPAKVVRENDNFVWVKPPRHFRIEKVRRANVRPWKAVNAA